MANDQTLGDLKHDDVDNLEYVLKHQKVMHFKDSKLAFAASGELVRLCVLKCGVDLQKLMALSESLDDVGELVEEALANNGIRIETRPYTNPIDEWRSGVYIYKNNEIAGWVGGIKKGELGGYSINTTEKMS